MTTHDALLPAVVLQRKAVHEGKHQRVRAGDHPISDVRGSAFEGQARRAEDLKSDRVRLGPVYRPWSRSRSAVAGGDQARLSEVPRTRQRPPSIVVDGVAERSLSLPVERPHVDIVRMAANQVP